MLFRSGTIGDGMLGLKALRGGLKHLSEPDRAALAARYRLPAPRVALGQALSAHALATAALDVSDGLVADMGHICAASGLAAKLDAAAVPHSAAGARAIDADAGLLARSLTGGDDYELLFTDPTIVTVMASPPYHAGIEQSLDFTASQSTTIEKYNSYTSGPGEDKVVFTSVPFDVYYYTIVSSPAAEDVGRTVSINIPREIQTLASSIGFYNDHNGQAPDVDENVFQHSPGDVWSYPSADDKNRILREAESSEPGYQSLWNGPRPVSEGSGYDTIGISTTEGSARGASMDLNVKLEFSSTSPGGAKVGSSIGFHYGYSYSLSTEDTAFFEGTVGNIAASDYTADNLYQYGLMVYPQQYGDQDFVVMNYWLERSRPVTALSPIQ